MKNYSYSQLLDLNKTFSNSYSLYGKQGHFNLNEALVPYEQLVAMLNDQDKAGILLTLPLSSAQSKDKGKVGTSKQMGNCEGKTARTELARYRKRVLTPPPKACWGYT